LDEDRASGETDASRAVASTLRGDEPTPTLADDFRLHPQLFGPGPAGALRLALGALTLDDRVGRPADCGGSRDR
jgi:hypothetical protein